MAGSHRMPLLVIGIQVLLMGTELAAAQTTEGQSFVVALPWIGSTTSPTTTDLMFTSVGKMATVQVMGVAFFEIIQVPVDGSNILTIGSEWYVSKTSSIENKALYVESDEPIRVSYCRSGIGGHSLRPDAALVLPVTSEAEAGYFEYLLSGAYFTHSHSSTDGYYMVAAYHDNTDIMVYKQGDGDTPSVNMTLNRYEVFTEWQRSYADAFGIVVSSKPVGVYCGSYYIQIRHSYDTSYVYQYIHDSVPPVDDLGTEYITIPIRYGRPEPSYVIRVIPVYDDTTIVIRTSDMVFATRDRGMKFDYDMQGKMLSDKGVLVTCSDKCLIVQFTKEVRTSSIRQMGMTMMTLTPVSLHTNSLLFSPPRAVLTDSAVDAMLAITINTTSVGNLFLNNTNLVDHPDWQTSEDGGGMVINIPIGWGIYHLHTEEQANHFAAYIYAVSRYDRAVGLSVGYGMRIGESTTTEEPTKSTEPIGSTTNEPVVTTESEITTADPVTEFTTDTPDVTTDSPFTEITTSKPPEPTTTVPGMADVPNYKLELLGSFSTDDGSNITAECNAKYTAALQNTAEGQRVQVNSMIGDSLCVNLVTEDFILVVSNILIAYNKDQAVTTLVYPSAVRSHLTMSQVYVCADEVTTYLKDHNNWDPTTIIPPQPDCPNTQFDPLEFTDMRDGNDWLCPSTQFENATMEEWVPHKDPWYTFYIQDDFIADGTLDISCIQDYNAVWQQAFMDMSGEINANISSGQLCVDYTHDIRTEPVSVVFSSGPTEGLISGGFSIVSDGSESSFDAMISCADELYKTVQHHDSWGDRQPPSDCPTLDFGDRIFEQTGEGWNCPEAAAEV